MTQPEKQEMFNVKIDGMDQLLGILSQIRDALNPLPEVRVVESTAPAEETIRNFAQKWQKMREAEVAAPPSTDVTNQLKQAGEKLAALQGLLEKFQNMDFGPKPEEQDK